MVHTASQEEGNRWEIDLLQYQTMLLNVLCMPLSLVVYFCFFPSFLCCRSLTGRSLVLATQNTLQHSHFLST